MMRFYWSNHFDRLTVGRLARCLIGDGLMTATTDFFEITPRNWRARLAISVDVMRELSRYTDPDDMYHVFTRRMTQIYPTARQVSLSRRGMERPDFKITRYNLWTERINPFKEPHKLPHLSGGILAELIYHDEPRIIDDLQVSPDDPAADYLEGQRSLLAIPLYERGVATNMVVLTREEPNAFPREQVPELVWMSNLFGRAMQTLVLSDQLKRAYDSAEYELRTIADLQHSLLPAAVPRVPGLEVAVHYRTANRAGGDYYDFFPLPDGRLGVLVADVSGHGTPAAVLMAITHGLAHSYPHAPTEPGAFLAHLNHHLARRYTGTTGNFLTAMYAVFDPKNSTMTFSSAGHVPARLCPEAGGRWRAVPNQHGLPLGVSPRETPYPEQTIAFGCGAEIAVVTDGIIDAVDPTGEPFGFDRLDQSLRSSNSDPDHVLRSVLHELETFAQGAPIADDRTLVVVCRTPC